MEEQTKPVFKREWVRVTQKGAKKYQGFDEVLDKETPHFALVILEGVPRIFGADDPKQAQIGFTELKLDAMKNDEEFDIISMHSRKGNQVGGAISLRDLIKQLMEGEED